MRRASCFDSKEEQLEEEKLVIQEILKSISLFAVVLLLLQSRKMSSSFVTLSILSLLRFYFLLRVAEAGYRFHLIKFGIRAPICFDEPWKSETIAEFWNRWNLSIAQQLQAIFYKPLARKGYSNLAKASIFLGSAGLHIVPVVTLNGSKEAIGSTTLFFTLQPILMALESYFKIRSQLWVHFVMWSISPLFALPLYEVL